MAKRKIIKIDESKCDGCGQCIPNCPEGALQMIDGKARLISDLFCDGLGACIGHCPKGAITIEEREAERYDERKVMENIVKQGPNVIKAHLEHLRDHGETGYLKEATDFLKKKGVRIPAGEARGHAVHPSGCPGARVMDFRETASSGQRDKLAAEMESRLRQWPVQIMLVPTNAPYLNGADLLVAADCVPFAYADFHAKLLKGKMLLVGCPKLDDIAYYKEKMAAMVKGNDIRTITYAHMEVPCCFGLVDVIRDAIAASGKAIPFKEVVISIKGEMS